MAWRLQREENIDLSLSSFPSPEEAIAALISGAAEALFIDNITLLEADPGAIEIEAVGPVLEGNSYVIALPVDAYLFTPHLPRPRRHLAVVAA